MKKSDPKSSTASGHAQVSDVAKSGQKQSRKIFVGHELRWTCGHREALCQKDQFTDDCKCHHICCKLGSKEKPKKSTDVSNGKILDYTDLDGNNKAKEKDATDVLTSAPLKNSTASPKKASRTDQDGAVKKPVAMSKIKHTTTKVVVKAKTKTKTSDMVQAVASDDATEIAKSSNARKSSQSTDKDENTSQADVNGKDKDKDMHNLNMDAREPDNNDMIKNDSQKLDDPDEYENNDSATRRRQPSRTAAMKPSLTAGISKNSQRSSGPIRNNSIASTPTKSAKSRSASSSVSSRKASKSTNSPRRGSKAPKSDESRK